MPEFIAQTLNGLTLAGIIFLVSSGFTLVFGVMRVTNLSHGAVYLVGGYIGYSVINATHNFFYGLAAGALAMAAFGYLLERTLISWLGRSEMAELLATLTGVAGVLYVFVNQLISPTTMDFSANGLFVIMAVLGGLGSIWGPALGAVVIVLFQQELSIYVSRWQTLMGLTLIAVVLLSPGGLWGLLRSAGRRWDAAIARRQRKLADAP